jgi:hypothetical protein
MIMANKILTNSKEEDIVGESSDVTARDFCELARSVHQDSAISYSFGKVSLDVYERVIYLGIVQQNG